MRSFFMISSGTLLACCSLLLRLVLLLWEEDVDVDFEIGALFADIIFHGER